MTLRRKFPNLYFNLVYLFYRSLWFFGFPIFCLYIFNRGRRDPRYSSNFNERLGKSNLSISESVWIFAASLGEVRASEPLVRKLIALGERIVMTHSTPAGKEAAMKLFAKEIEEKKIFSIYNPFDNESSIKRLIKAINPKYTLVMEMEYWPSMIQVHKNLNIPILLCNGHYPKKSIARDKNRFLSSRPFIKNFFGVMVKNDNNAKRFEEIGVKNIAITGEMKFDQEIPQALINASKKLLQNEKFNRPIITLTSIVLDEEDRFISIIKTVLEKINDKKRPLFVFVPRAPERFDIVASKLLKSGITYARRSSSLDSNLNYCQMDSIDVLLGDSLGEMFFYINLSVLTITGGGFTEGPGSHGISESLMLHKPVIIGENSSNIDYISEEAINQGVAKMMNLKELEAFLLKGDYIFASKEKIQHYLSDNTGSTNRTLIAINELLNTRYKL